MNIGKDHVKVNPDAKPKNVVSDPVNEGKYATKVSIREAYKSLATAIGMNLSEVRHKKCC